MSKRQKIVNENWVSVGESEESDGSVRSDSTQLSNASITPLDMRKCFGNNGRLLRACQWTLSIAQKDYDAFKAQKKSAMDFCELWRCYTTDRATTEISNGERNLKALVEMLKKADTIGWRRSPQQIQFHRAFIAACLQKIMDNDLGKNVIRLMQEYGLDELRNDVIICTPRRWGKTTSVALFAAAYILTQPNCEVAIYSTGRRASKKLLALIWQIVSALAGSGVKRAYNQEMLAVAGPGTRPGIVYAYPSKEQIDLHLIYITHIFYDCKLLTYSVLCLSLFSPTLIVSHFKANEVHELFYY